MAYTTIDNPELYFQTVLWTGNSTNDRAITFDNTDADLDPDLIWIKKRADDAEDHALHDTVRGISSSAKLLNPNGTGAEETHGNNGFVSAVTADTFTLKTNDASGSDGYQYNNHNTDTYVAWCWKESATAGFDICSWTGNGSAQNISHNLSKVPTMIIVKNRTDSTDWYCYNVHNGNTHSILLNSSGAKVGAYSDNWNDTTPTSSVFSVGSSNSTGGSSSDNMIAYVFTDIQGFSKVSGKYTGNGNVNGPFCYTGFRPAFVITKRTDSSTNGHWSIFDTKRNTHNVNDLPLRANSSNAQSSIGNYAFDILSNGFKPRGTNTTNDSGGTFIYIAFAEAPFVNSKGVPCNAR